MGNFYCNFVTVGPSADDVLRTLTKQRRSAFITPTVNARTVVFERDSDKFTSENDIETVGTSLSRELNCPVLAAVVADDDELWLALFVCGRCTVKYSSRGANAGAYAFCRAFGRVWLTPVVWILLQWPYLIFEHLRHAMLARLLGIPSWCVASGYRYIAGGELPDGLAVEDLRQTGRDM